MAVVFNQPYRARNPEVLLYESLRLLICTIFKNKVGGHRQTVYYVK